MKQQMVMRVVGKSLRPDGDVSWDVFERLPRNKQVIVTVRTARNPDHLRRYWSICAVVADYWEGFDDREDADHWVRLKIPSMHREYEVKDDPIHPGKKRTVIRPLSIAIESMDQTAFDTFYKRAMEYFSVLLGCDVETLAKEVWDRERGKRAP